MHLPTTYFWLGLFSLCLMSCHSVTKDKQAPPPNVLFLAIDDLNTWLGCMDGHPNAKTPNLDRLAIRGTLFTNAHCQAPICGPSRASLMTGLRPSTTGIYGQISDNKIREADSLLTHVTFLPQYFQQAGYKTMGKGKLFHRFAPEGVFEERGGREGGFGPKPEKRFKYDPAWFGKPPGTQTDWGVYPARDEDMIDYQTAQWAIERLQQEHDRPFFLAAGFIRPHVPFYAPQKWFDLHPLDSIQLPPYLLDDQGDIPEISVQLHEILQMPTTEWAKEQDEWKAIVQAYLACISFVDHYVGQVLDALEASPYAENTVVVVWSDHGYHIGEKNRFAKHSLWEEATRVPLIFAGPGIGAKAVCDRPVELLDLYPTLLDLCGLAPNAQNEGKSIRPLLENPLIDWTKPAITTYGRNNHSVRSQQHRYIHFEDGSEEFYDHAQDPHEWNNLIQDSESSDSYSKWIEQLPRINKPWSPANSKGANAYLEAQRQRDVELGN
ncbi:MAG: sulfatase [Saprospiraceae bacterium]|nr:sulfatase [Saprospiraceae bacterium]